MYVLCMIYDICCMSFHDLTGENVCGYLYVLWCNSVHYIMCLIWGCSCLKKFGHLSVTVP